MNRWLRVPRVALLIGVCALVYVGLGFWHRITTKYAEDQAPHLQRFNLIRIGYTESKVREILGPPRWVYVREVGRRESFRDGCLSFDRPIGFKVLVYREMEVCASYWISKDGIVENVTINGS